MDDFGVDHYRPKSNPLFAALQTEYMNLYYCCNRCNRLKRNYWPTTAQDAQKRFIPNPCDYSMFDHLRYRRGQVVPASSSGEFTVERLILNDQEAVDFRDGFIAMLARLNSEMVASDLLLAEARDSKAAARTDEERQAADEAIDLVLQAQALQKQELEHAIGPLTLAAHSGAAAQ